MTKNKSVSQNKSKQLRFKVGIMCILGAFLSIAVMALTSLDDILFPLFFIFLFAGIILISSTLKWSTDTTEKNNIKNWTMGDTIHPFNPFNREKK